MGTLRQFNAGNIMRGVMAAAMLAAGAMLLASPAAGQSPPDAPSSVKVTRGTFGQGVLNVSWSRVKGPVLYNVRYSDDGGQTWDDGPSRVSGTSASISGVNDGLPYYVAVQADSGKSASAWTQSALANVECPEGHACAMTDPPGAETQSNPPDAPSSITLERTGTGFRGKGTLTASWPAVSDATKYQVNYTADKGRVWKTLASEHTSNSITFEIWNGNTYIIGVRAGNANGWSGWTNSLESPPIPNPLPSNMLPGPDWVSVTRGNGTLTATWAAVSGATRYFIRYSTDFGTTFQLLSNNHPSTSITMNANNGSTYIISVRSGKGSGDHWNNFGPVSYSARSGPYVPNYTPPPSPSLSAGSVTHNTATLTLSNYGVQWWYKADTGPHAACSNIAVAGSSVNLSGLTPSTQYTYTAYSNWVCNTAIATASAFTTAAPPPTLTTSAIGRTTATLTIANHTAQWWYQADVGPDSTCQGPVAAGTSAESLTGLTEETPYVYKAYSATGCGATNLLATAASFTTLPPPHVSILDHVSTGDSTITGSVQQAVDFTTGPNSGGYTLTSVTIPLRKKTAGTGTLAITLHAASGDWPAATPLATLTGTSPTSSTWTNTPFTCTGAGCNLSPSTNYFIVATQSNNSGEFSWRYDGATPTQSRSPSDNGWTIGKSAQKTGSNWTSWNDWHIFRADFEYKDFRVTVSSITATTATLTIFGHTDAWYYKATTGPHTTCQGPVAAGTSTASLTGLTPGTPYTYSAYSDSTCTTGNLLATAAQFTTPTLTVSSITATGATLTIANHTAAWYYKATTGPHTTCQGPVAANTSTKALTGLTAGTSYVYSAYSDSGCSTLLATAASFTTPVSVSNLSKTATGGAILYSAYPRLAQAFTTGSNSGGYTLDKVTVHLQVGSSQTLTVTLHDAASNGNDPTGNALVTLASGAYATGEHTFTCSGSGCDLDADTTYVIQLSAGGGVSSAYYWRRISTTDEDQEPNNNGWSIGNRSRYYQASDSTWNDETGGSFANALKLTATVKASGSGSSSSVTATSATAAPQSPPGATVTSAGGIHAASWDGD